MIARPCGATTLPRQPENGLAFTQDVDRDGVFDLTVANSIRSELRVAFSDGPEVAIPYLLRREAELAFGLSKLLGIRKCSCCAG
jgi:hypothetical protein